MHSYRISLFFILLTITIWYALQPTPAQAQFQPPDNVTLTILRLNSPGGSTFIDPSTNRPVPCTQAVDEIARSYGCTADSTKPYPFDTSTITIGIDGASGPDNLYYGYPYLWDVVTEEYGLHLGSQQNKPLAGVKAQAIAARAYLYQRIYDAARYPDTLNNSAQFHVFLPYAYETRLTTDEQRQRLQEAMQARLYLTPPSNPLPIVALYGTDNPEYTAQGLPEGSGEGAEGNGYNPRLSVWDPISAAYGEMDGTANGGMSSKGASRWSFGHTSSRGPVAANDAQYPHDVQGFGDFWSVRWDDAFQILTHYYTGIHIRDANNPATALTPAYRWVPLQTGLLFACAGRDSTVTVTVQNTGTVAWPANSAIPRFTNLGEAAAAETSAPQAAALPNELLPGEVDVVNLLLRVAAPGLYRYRLDFYLASVGLLHEQSPPWPRYEEFMVQVDECAYGLYTPMVMSTELATFSSH
jgi:hypothetical protein